MRYHIEYAKYKYGYVTIVGWLTGETAEEETAVGIWEKKGPFVAADVTRIEREDISRIFFPGERKQRYGFRIRYASSLDQVTVLVLQAGDGDIKRKVEPWKIRWTGSIPDNWKEAWKQRFDRMFVNGEKALRRAWDGAVNLYDERDNFYQSAREFAPARPWQFSGAPVRFSILVPLYQTNREHLLDLLSSVYDQSYGRWELCLADGSPESILADCESKAADPEDQIARRITEILHDSRVKYRHLEQNLGISGNTNACLEMATGEYVVMADHDDVLIPDALWTVAEAIKRNPDVDFLYSSSDLTDQDHLYNYNPLFKPAWSPEMLYSANYITHLSIVRTSLVRELGGFRPEYDGAQDWDLFLRIGEVTDQIEMIPRVLYHWRAAAGSTALMVEEKPYARQAQLKAVQDHLDRTGIPGQARFVDGHSTCIRVRFSDVSDGAGTGAVRIVTAPGLELSPEEERELCAWANVSGIGIVGVRVLDRSGKIQSQGALLLISSAKRQLYAGEKPGTADAVGHTDWYRNDLIPHTACYAVPAVVAEAIGMPDADGGEAAMTEWFLKMKEAGYRSLITPFVEVCVEAS